MKVHVYKVYRLFVVNTDIKDESEALQIALEAVKDGQVQDTQPECEFVAVVPGGQETTI